MTDITIEVQGPGAKVAAEDLLNKGTLQGESKVVEDDQREVLTAIATVVTIIGGSLAAANVIKEWYEDWKTRESKKKITGVLILRDGKDPVFLSTATLDQIEAIFKDH